MDLFYTPSKDLFCHEQWDLDELMVFCHDAPYEPVKSFTFFTVFDKKTPYYPIQAVKPVLSCDEHLKSLYPSFRPPTSPDARTAFQFFRPLSRPLLSVGPIERMCRLVFKGKPLESVLSYAAVKDLFDYWCPRSIRALNLELEVLKTGVLFNPFQLTHEESLYVWIRTLVFCRLYYLNLPSGVNQVIPLCLYEHHALCTQDASSCRTCLLWESCWEFMLSGQKDFKVMARNHFATSQFYYAHLF